jgi:type III secretion protein Q
MSTPRKAQTRAMRTPKPLAEKETDLIETWSCTEGRQVTRAHVRLCRQPAFAAALGNTLPAISRAIGKAIKCEVRVEAQLTEHAALLTDLMARYSVFAIFELAVSKSRAVLEVTSNNLEQLMRRTGVESSRATTDPLSRREEEALVRCFGAAIQSIQHDPVWAEGFRPRLIGFFNTRAEAIAELDPGVRYVDVCLRTEINGMRDYWTLLVPGHAIEKALLKAGLVSKPVPVASAIANATVEFTVAAGWARVSYGDYERLAPDDLLMISGIGWHAGHLVGEGHICNDGLFATGVLFPRGLELQHFRTALTREAPMTKEMARSMLPIEIEVELKRMTMPLSELATLRPGAILPLNYRHGDTVTIKVGERPVARAELVDIDGEVGARILQLVEGEER